MVRPRLRQYLMDSGCRLPVLPVASPVAQVREAHITYEQVLNDERVSSVDSPSTQWGLDHGLEAKGRARLWRL